jgi:hypothetical protein
MMVQRPRVFEDREYTQPTTPWLWKDHDVQLQKTPTGWAVLDGDETICVAGTVSAALIVFDNALEGMEDGTED